MPRRKSSSYIANLKRPSFTNALSSKGKAAVDQGCSSTRELVKQYTSSSLNINLESIRNRKVRTPLYASTARSSRENSNTNILRKGLKPHTKLQNDFNVLKFLFPQFPEKMMKILIVREQGNTRNVANFLVLRGWGGPSPLIKNLSSDISEHVSTPHFWGIFKPEYLEFLASKPIGSFFVVFERPGHYVLYYINIIGLIGKSRVRGPNSFGKKITQKIGYGNALHRTDIPLQDLIIFD